MTDKKITRSTAGSISTSSTHFDDYVNWINENMKTTKAVIRQDENGRRYFDLVTK